MSAHKFLFLLFLCSSTFGAIDLTREHIEFGTSVSHAYDARSVFTNPAALGFQTALNGVTPMTSFTVGVNKTRGNEFSLGLALGYLGLGVEKLAVPTGDFTRFSFGLGVPLNPYLYFGSRFSFTSSSVVLADDYKSWDIGLQFRPYQIVSLGFLAEAVNQPTVDTQVKDTRFTLSASVRPIDRLLLQTDFFGLARNFRNDLGYQFLAQFEILNGLYVNGGYHKDFSYFAGIRLNFGLGAYYAVGRPDTADQSIAFGIQSSGKPYHSFLNPSATYATELGAEMDEKGRKGNLLMPERAPFLKHLRELDQISKGNDFSQVFVVLSGFPMGYAAAEDYREALLKLRKQGKEIHVFLGNAGLKEYFIASVANVIHLDPSGTVEFEGLKQSRYFVKGTLDKLGISGEFFAKGKYKSAPEMFTRTDSSEAHKSSTMSNLALAEQLILDRIKETRPEVASRWKKLHQQVLYSAHEAKEAGLIDQISSVTEKGEDISKGRWIRKSVDFQKDHLALLPRITVIAADGDIMSASDSLLSFGGMSFVTPDSVAKDFKAALNDPRTKAIVLRISSPGGEVLASQEIASIIEKAREKKPVFVSMGDVAASGGYMIAAPGDKIFARDLTLTGSIGVFMGKPNLSGFYKKIGISKETLSHHPFANLYSEADPLTAEGREIFQRRLDNFYKYFTGYVAEKRKLDPTKVEEGAQGRVWFGKSAKELSLIDETRGYLDSIGYAAASQGLREYESVVVNTSGSLFSLFGGGEPNFARALFDIPKVSLPGVPLSLLAPRERFEFLYFCPEGSLQ